jgi:uncharacterized phage infection (PIP) family protein YhgE
MRFQTSRKIAVRWLVALTLVVTFAVATTAQTRAQEADAGGVAQQTDQNMSKLYRESVQEHRTEIGVYEDNVERIDDAITALRNELAEENRRGRADDLRFRLEQLEERKSSLDEKIDTARDAVSSADTAEEAFHGVLREDLMRQQEQTQKELDELDSRIATLEAELAEQRGVQVKERNIRAQIDELARKREELAAQPDIRPDNLAEEAALHEAAARSFAEREAARREQLTSVRESIAELERSLKQENRRAREKSLEAQIQELKMKEHELAIGPINGKRNGADEPLDTIKRGLKAEELRQTRRVDVLERKAAQLREQLESENRSARRKSLQLQIRELEHQQQRVGKPEQVPLPPITGFSGAPYGSAWDLDYEYQLQE